MKYYKYLCGIVAVDIAIFGVVSLFYRPASGGAASNIMRYCFFLPLVAVCALQLAGLLVNIVRGYVNTIGATRFVVYRYDDSRPLFFTGVLCEIVLWTLPAYGIVSFLAGTS